MALLCTPAAGVSIRRSFNTTVFKCGHQPHIIIFIIIIVTPPVILVYLEIPKVCCVPSRLHWEYPSCAGALE